MIKFSETIVIDRQPDQVFDLTQDYNRRLEWDTFLKRAELVNEAQTAGKDIKAYCVAKNGLGMETIYVSFNRPKVAAIKMTRGPYMFRSFNASWNFKEAGNKTEVIFLYSFKLRFPFNLIQPLVKRILQKDVQKRLIDLKRYMEITMN